MSEKTALPSQRQINLQYTLLQIGFWAMCAAFLGYQTALLLSRGFTSSQVGFFSALRCLAGITAQPLIGRWADRHPNIPLKWIFCVSLLAALAANFLFYWYSPGFWGTAMVFLVLGALELTAYPLLDAMAVQFISAGVQVNYSLSRGIGAMAYALTCVVVGRQTEQFGIETALLSHGGLIVGLLVVMALFPVPCGENRLPKNTTEKPHSAGYLLRQNPAYALTLVASFLAFVSISPLGIFLVNVVVDRGGTTASLGLAQFLMSSSELPAALLFRKLWRRYGTWSTMVAALCGLALRPLLNLLSPSLWILLAVQPIQMLGFGLFTPASVYLTNESVSRADRVQGQTLMMVASNGLGGVIGNLAGGWLIDRFGVDAMMLGCVVCGILAAITGFAAYRLHQKNSQTIKK